MEPKVICELHKGENSVIRIETTRFEGCDILVLRRYYRKNDKWLPGRSGLNMSFAKWPPVVEALEKALKDLGVSAHARDK